MSPIRIEQCDPARVNAKYLAIVSGLLLLVIVVLAQLWQVERTKRIGLQQQLTELYLKQHVLTVAPAEAGDQRVVRDDLPREEVLWNGAKRQVMLVSASAGWRMGLEPEDIVRVVTDPTPTSQP